MYYSGINPETGKKVFVARNPHDKAMQRALMQYKNPKNRQLVKEALQQTNRGDLIGDDDIGMLATLNDCLSIIGRLLIDLVIAESVWGF